MAAYNPAFYETPGSPEYLENHYYTKCKYCFLLYNDMEHLTIDVSNA